MSIHNRQLGLFGFGVVGKGLYDVLKSSPALKASIKKVCIKDENKRRNVTDIPFTIHAAELLDDESIDVIIELIDDADAAYVIVKAALQKGKSVVSANKKMIATHFDELYRLQAQYGGTLLYEAACCASIPIIRNLEEYYDNDMLHALRGIVNGSANYILTCTGRNLSFSDALLKAQQLGFAESDPSLDIEGYDPANKLSILIAHAFGTWIPPQQIIFSGITTVDEQDSVFAKEKKLRIRLVAQAHKLSNGGLAALVLPSLVSSDDELYNVEDEFNGIITESCFADKHFFKGKGAGAFPTAAAVLSDISALGYGYKYGYKKIWQTPSCNLSHDYYLKVSVSTKEITAIPTAEFEWIEERHNAYGHCRVIGVIHAAKLAEDLWWKQPGISLILCKDPIIENIHYRAISKKSLELAGIV